MLCYLFALFQKLCLNDIFKSFRICYDNANLCQFTKSNISYITSSLHLFVCLLMSGAVNKIFCIYNFVAEKTLVYLLSVKRG